MSSRIFTPGVIHLSLAASLVGLGGTGTSAVLGNENALISRAAPARGAETSSRNPRPDAPARRVASLLKSAYTVRLVSDWPVYAGETDACNNRGSETLEGTLTRIGADRYAGHFNRRTVLGFCGNHGSSAIAGCSSRLDAEGMALMVMTVSNGAGGLEGHMIWQPDTAATTARVSGTCSPTFQRALRAMYLSTSHGIEVPLTAGDGEQRLPDYGWVATVK